jgi:hypothetical protein
VRHVVHKLQRWSLKMSVFTYRMEHVARYGKVHLLERSHDEMESRVDVRQLA